ncbi:MAG: anthranilate phosphoribosyltransferase [Candidatus Altiarchaeales archaeon ex4484_96]|nr:MAG: anthranilate phosphoribosyltransferase [Candidatus Altiarchaeales archaeon ex4484_96]
MKEIISRLIDEVDLSAGQANRAMKTIMSGEASHAQMAAFLTALKMKGETPTEIAAFASVMRDYASRVNPRVEGTLVDVCGTGGDGLKTFNISTTSMFIVAAAGIPVAKHGNRSITSGCGSADVLEALGVDLNLSVDKIAECIEQVGIGFMFAPAHHASMKYVMPVRKELGVRTVFNILGPLTNPANASAQLMGVYDPMLTDKLAQVFKLLGLEHAMVVYGEPGLDELSTLGKSRISELKDGKVSTYYVKSEEYGLECAKLGELAGGTPKVNAGYTRKILSGEIKGPMEDIVLLNAAGGLVVGGKAKTIGEGVELARDVLDSGLAQKKMDDFIGFI